MSTTNQHPYDQSSEAPNAGIQPRFVGGKNLPYSYLAATLANPMTQPGNGSIAIDNRLQSAQSYQQPLAQNNPGYSQPVQAQQPTTFFQNQQPFNQVRQEPIYETIPQTMKSDGGGLLRESNNGKENLESKQNLTELAQRQPNAKSQQMVSATKAVYNQNQTEPVGIDSRPAGKRREPGILQRWSVTGIKRPKEFSDFVATLNPNLDKPKLKSGEMSKVA
ncbi:MAG: hypothetical protein WCK98_00870 [bacterium]